MQINRKVRCDAINRHSTNFIYLRVIIQIFLMDSLVVKTSSGKTGPFKTETKTGVGKTKTKTGPFKTNNKTSVGKTKTRTIASPH